MAALSMKSLKLSSYHQADFLFFFVIFFLLTIIYSLTYLLAVVKVYNELKAKKAPAIDTHKKGKKEKCSAKCVLKWLGIDWNTLQGRGILIIFFKGSYQFAMCWFNFGKLVLESLYNYCKARVFHVIELVNIALRWVVIIKLCYLVATPDFEVNEDGNTPELLETL